MEDIGYAENSALGVDSGDGSIVPSYAAAQEESESAKVRTLEVRLMESYKERQIDLLASLLDDDFVITFEDGSTLRKDGLHQLQRDAIGACRCRGDVGCEDSDAWRHRDIDGCVSRAGG